MALERLIGQAGDDRSCDAAFAFRSAYSFPGIPQWSGTHCRLILDSAALSSMLIISVTVSKLLSIALSSAWLSLQINTVLVWWESVSQFMAIFIASHSSLNDDVYTLPRQLMVWTTSGTSGLLLLLPVPTLSPVIIITRAVKQLILLIVRLIFLITRLISLIMQLISLIAH